MTFVGKMRGAWARRLTIVAMVATVLPALVGVVGGSATAGAFSRPGLPVEYLMVPSAGNHSWAYWGAQLQALKPDLIATVNG